MKKAALWSSILGLVITASGCGGGAAAGLLRDGTNIYSELVDSMSKVVDEPSAQKFVNLDEKRLKEKWENLKKKMEGFMRFGDDKDVDELAYLWVGDGLHNKGKKPGPVAALLQGPAQGLMRRLEKKVKTEGGGVAFEGKPPLTEEDFTSGRVPVKQVQGLLDQKSTKHLLNESAAARELFDQQMKRIKALRLPEPYADIDLKLYTGDP